MQVKELGHVVLFVRNIQKSVHFYGDILGFKQLETPMRGAAMFSSGRTHHEMLLIEVGPDAPLPSRGRRAGLYHIGLKIGDSLDELRAAKAELEAAGVEIAGLSDHTVSKSIYLFDPDGNEIEIFIDDPDVDWRSDLQAVAAPTKRLQL